MAPLPRFEINNGSSIAVQARLRSSEDLLKIDNPYAPLSAGTALVCYVMLMLCYALTKIETGISGLPTLATFLERGFFPLVWRAVMLSCSCCKPSSSKYTDP